MRSSSLIRCGRSLSLIADLQMAQASAERVLSLLDTKPAVTGQTGSHCPKYGDGI
jgi:ABC-type multidrug transport system fused ATPase/permease subunit